MAAPVQSGLELKPEYIDAMEWASYRLARNFWTGIAYLLQLLGIIQVDTQCCGFQYAARRSLPDGRTRGWFPLKNDPQAPLTRKFCLPADLETEPF